MRRIIRSTIKFDPRLKSGYVDYIIVTGREKGRVFRVIEYVIKVSLDYSSWFDIKSYRRKKVDTNYRFCAFMPTINEPMKMTRSNFFTPTIPPMIYCETHCTSFHYTIKLFRNRSPVRFHLERRGEVFSVQGISRLLFEKSVGMRGKIGERRSLAKRYISWLYNFHNDVSNGKTVDEEDDADRNV